MVEKLEEMNEKSEFRRKQNNKRCQRGLSTSLMGLSTSLMALVCAFLFSFNIYTTTRRTQLSERHYQRSIDRLDKSYNKNIQTLDGEFQSVIDRLDKSHTDSLYQLHENLVRVTKEAFDNCFSDYEEN